MTPSELLTSAIVPALTFLNLDSPQARHQMLAIALQESALKHRQQVTASGKEDGPAVSFWQFEKGGGCKGVLTHDAVKERMRAACVANGVAATPAALWEAMRTNDVLGAIAARLLLYTLPDALPTNAAEGWRQYIEAWRPGKPHPEKWAAYWATADCTARGLP